MSAESRIGHRTRLLILTTAGFVYLVLGALIFSFLEAELERDTATELRDLRADFAAQINESATDEELEYFIQRIVEASQIGILATNNVTFRSSWTFGQSFFFVGTFVTTIGYGHTIPLSYSGKVFAIFYGLCGLPLAVIIFSALASKLTYPLKLLLKYLQKKLYMVKKDMHVRLLHLLIVLLIVTVFFFFIPGAIFYALEENWTYEDCLYYCFISLTTIGLGDYIPGETYEQPFRAMYKVAVTFYLFMGLIFLYAAITVLCDIKELDLVNYFVQPPGGAEQEEDHEQLTLKSINTKPTSYTQDVTTDDEGLCRANGTNSP